MRTLVLIAAAGAAGSVARYAVGLALPARAGWPRGTLLVNVVGCLLIGAIMGLAHARPGAISPEARLVIVTGFLGAFTTYSAFAYESFELARAGRLGQAAAYAALTIVLGWTAAAAGWFAASSTFRSAT